MHNNSPYYRHVDTTELVGRNMNKIGDGWTGAEELVYRNKKGEWCMGTGLDSFCHGIYNENKTDSVPLEGWKCWNGDASFDDEAHWWIEDPHLKITKPSDPSYPLPCGNITIEATGNSVLRRQNCFGVFKSFENEFSAGRRVFKHSSMNRYLIVRPGTTAWSVNNTEVNKMESGCAPTMCPADPRAMKSQRYDTTSWRYYDGEKCVQGDITVKCSVHKWEEGEEKICWNCHASVSEPGVKLLMCSSCRKARYCDKECQVQDWGRHKEFCVIRKEKRKNKSNSKTHK